MHLGQYSLLYSASLQHLMHLCTSASLLLLQSYIFCSVLCRLVHVLEHVKGMPENFWGFCRTPVCSGTVLKTSCTVLPQDSLLHPLWLCLLGLGTKDSEMVRKEVEEAGEA